MCYRHGSWRGGGGNSEKVRFPSFGCGLQKCCRDWLVGVFTFEMTSCPVALSIKKLPHAICPAHTSLEPSACECYRLAARRVTQASPQLVFLGVEGDCELVDEKGGSERHSDFLVSNLGVSAKCDCMDMCLNVADL